MYLSSVHVRVRGQLLRSHWLGWNWGGVRRLSLQYYVRWMNTVTVFFSFPQLATNKTNCNHSSVTAHHFSWAAFRKIKDSCFQTFLINYGFPARKLVTKSHRVNVFFLYRFYVFTSHRHKIRLNYMRVRTVSSLFVFLRLYYYCIYTHKSTVISTWIWLEWYVRNEGLAF